MGYKKTLLVVLAGVLVLGVASGCDKDKEKQNESNNAVVEKVKDLQTDGTNKEFADLMEVNMSFLTSQTGLTSDEVENALGQLPTELDSTFYLAVKPKSGNSKFGGTNKERVQRLIGNYIDSLKTRLEPSPVSNEEELTEEEKAERAERQKKYDMLNNMTIEEYKGYLIYISSSDNKKVLSTIKKGL